MKNLTGMNILLIFNRHPYDGTSTVSDALALAHKLRSAGGDVRVFIMPASVDLVREKVGPSSGANLKTLLSHLIGEGVPVRFHTRNPSIEGPFIKGAEESDPKSDDLVQWIKEAGRVLTF